MTKMDADLTSLLSASDLGNNHPGDVKDKASSLMLLVSQLV